MKIRLLVPRGCFATGEVLDAGMVIEVASHEAAKMVEAMQAEYVEQTETGMMEVVAPPRRGRPRKNVETRNA